MLKKKSWSTRLTIPSKNHLKGPIVPSAVHIGDFCSLLKKLCAFIVLRKFRERSTTYSLMITTQPFFTFLPYEVYQSAVIQTAMSLVNGKNRNFPINWFKV